jgi:hypothetical protein
VTPSTSTAGATTSPPPPPPPPTVISGTVTDFAAATPLSGFTVTVGVAPSAGSCNAAQTNALNVCGTVASTVATATTAADGTFSATVPAGTYMLTIGKDGTYATLHRTYTAAAGANALGSVKLTALSATLQAWLADVNSQRATVATPASFANLQVDEYAQEQAQKWSNDVAAGTTVYGDAAYGPYQSGYGASPGTMYGVAGVLAILFPGAPPAFSAETLAVADTSWMSEKASSAGPGGTTVGCGAYSGNWQTCPFSAYTGHYINISNTQDVWVGLGTSAAQILINGTPSGFPTNIMIIQNGGSLGPAARLRVAAGPQ